MSLKILLQLPFSKGLRNVPEYAGGHHEKLNGHGYPSGLTADELPLQARILAVADVFEALTAPDRPYRAPMPLAKAMDLLDIMVDEGDLDGEIVDLFRQSGVFMVYAQKELGAEQYE